MLFWFESFLFFTFFNQVCQFFQEFRSFLFGTEEIATGTVKKWVQLTGTVDQVMLPGSPQKSKEKKEMLRMNQIETKLRNKDILRIQERKVLKPL